MSNRELVLEVRGSIFIDIIPIDARKYTNIQVTASTVIFFSLQACYRFETGNINLNLLTSAKRYKLRVDMTTFDGNVSYAEYDNFNVSSSADNYTLVSIGTYRGTAGRLNYCSMRRKYTHACD